MKALRAIWRELSLFMGWSVPSEVTPGYPKTLDEYRERVRRINETEKLAAIARRRVREHGT